MIVRRMLAGLAVSLAASLAACRDAPPPADEPPAAGPPGVRYVAVQLAALRDSARAAALADSLDAAGWSVLLRPAGRRETRVWRVHLQPTTHLAYPELVAAALRRELGDTGISVVHDSGLAFPPAVTGFTRVRYGEPAIAQPRWALSPDRRTLLVVERAAGIEDDPAPDGFVFATETGMRLIQMDSVWDVAPAPDWERVAVGRAYLLDGGRTGSVPDSVWSALADETGIGATALRRGAFAASGMNEVVGVAQPGVVSLSGSRPMRGEPTLFPVTGGWRVGWSDDGRRLLAGTPPKRPRDSSDPTGWVALSPSTGSLLGTADGKPAEVAWIDGPLLDPGAPAAPRPVMPVPSPGASITSDRGWIRRDGRIVGPGTALAATREGRHVLALVPVPGERSGEEQEILAVYSIDASAEFPNAELVARAPRRR